MGDDDRNSSDVATVELDAVCDLVDLLSRESQYSSIEITTNEQVERNQNSWFESDELVKPKRHPTNQLINDDKDEVEGELSNNLSNCSLETVGDVTWMSENGEVFSNSPDVLDNIDQSALPSEGTDEQLDHDLKSCANKLKRVNAVKIKRSQTETHMQRPRPSRRPGHVAEVCCRRHSIQGVTDGCRDDNGVNVRPRTNTSRLRFTSCSIREPSSSAQSPNDFPTQLYQSTMSPDSGSCCSSSPSAASTSSTLESSALDSKAVGIGVHGGCQETILVSKSIVPSSTHIGGKVKKISWPSANQPTVSSAAAFFGHRSVGGIFASRRSLSAFPVAFDARKMSSVDRSSTDYLRVAAAGDLPQKRPSECFTLKFEMKGVSAGGETQVLPALKECSLSQMLVGPLEQRGLGINQVDVFLESSNTALPLSSECFRLAGSILRLRLKNDGRKIFHQKSSSFSGSQPSNNNKRPAADNLRSKRNGSSTTVASSGDDCGSMVVYPTDSNLYGTLTRPASVGNTAATDPLKARAAAAARGTGSRLQALFIPFAKAQDKQEVLSEILSGYTTGGFPRNSNNYPSIGSMSAPILFTNGNCVGFHSPLTDHEVHQFALETSWTDVVVGHQALNKRQRDHQEAVWELLTTEVDYINKLRVVIDLFACCLTNLQSDQLLTEIDADKLFSNIREVYAASCNFWTKHLRPVVEHSRATGEMLNSNLFKSGFLMFDRVFEPYTRYCLEQEACIKYIKTKTSENELFRMFLSWCESQRECDRLKLSDLLVKPWQRLTRYKLLLFAMRTPLDKMDSSDLQIDEQISAIDAAIGNVEKFVHAVNLALRQRQDHHQLSLVTDRIESYDVIEAPNDECSQLVNEFCKLDLNCSVPGCGPQEIRTLLLEGGLRLKDTYAKADVYCFLFTDMFLVTKQVGKRNSDKVKVIKPPMRLDKIVVHALRDPSSFMMLYLNEYNVAQTVYIFFGDSKSWLESIVRAQSEYRDKRTQNLARLDAAAATFDLYTELDVDDDNPIDYSLTDRHQATVPGLSRNNSDSSSASSVDRAPAASRSDLPVRPEVNYSTMCHDESRRMTSSTGNINNDVATIIAESSTAQTNSTAAIETYDGKRHRKSLEARRRCRGNVSSLAGDESTTDGDGRTLRLLVSVSDDFSTQRSCNGWTSADQHSDSSSPAATSSSTNSVSLDVWLASSKEPASDVCANNSPTSEVMSPSLATSIGDDASVTSFDGDRDTRVVEEPSRKVPSHRIRRAKVSKDCVNEADRTKRSSVSARAQSSSSTLFDNGEVEVADSVHSSDKESPPYQHQKQQQHQSSAVPMGHCLIDKEVVLNNAAAETSEV